MVTLIPGDGTGPELTEVVKAVVAASGVPITWEVQEAGAEGRTVTTDVGGTAGTKEMGDAIIRALRQP
ncbi:MAG: hypothetical protein HYZ73_08850 [Elusimicrobia bacterium]|nr:hypothetical protein [Elusimicrobiota bacterium]